MFMERLTIRNFRRVKELDLEFRHTLTVLPAQHAEVILKAIGILTKNEALSGPKAAWKLGKRAELALTIRLAEGRFRIACRRDPETERTEWKVEDDLGRAVDSKRFFTRIHEAPAEAEARVFTWEQGYEEVLRSYEEPDRYLTARLFFRKTEGIGTTRLFRMKLRELRNKGLCGADGEVEIRGPSGTGGPGTQSFSGTSAAKRNFELFLRLNALWDGIEKIRDIHHERWPIFVGSVKDFTEAGRQVIAW